MKSLLTALSVLTIGATAGNLSNNLNNSVNTNNLKMKIDNKNKSKINFNYKNLIISLKDIYATCKDIDGNLYYSTFDNSDIHISGEKMWKYNINTKKNEIYWENQNFKIGSFNMAIDNKGNIYLGSAGGVQILYDKNKSKTMPLVTNATTSIIYFKNNIYVTTFDGFYKYNINTKITKKLNLPNNSIPNSVFIDSNENIYLSIYKSSIKCSVLIIKKGELDANYIFGDEFFNINNVIKINEINNKIYFIVSNLQNQNKLYLWNNKFFESKVSYILDLPNWYANILNIYDKPMLEVQVNKNLIIYDIKENKLREIYKIKNSLVTEKIINDFKKLYFAINNWIDELTW